ncbi:type II toxin-antitoxin system ParD family antitoxin [Aquibium oceanicum]|uniref:Addiction module antitoxin n=1 Tax=Aquibium oceanicum TaxID=1670800 RepID=A0A1L3STU3_9HYPH|nr:type II toxin-antitoxin system ParD family antitoxin [Aquibium oceanicum]APH72781.1 addiction module antitoxin [Aquibium oceanicum]
MGPAQQRSITISSELADEVDEAVASGEYPSASEVVVDALRQWKERRDNFGYSLEELKRLVQEGIDSGPAEEGAPFMERLRRKYAAMEK